MRYFPFLLLLLATVLAPRYSSHTTSLGAAPAVTDVLPPSRTESTAEKTNSLFLPYVTRPSTPIYWGAYVQNAPWNMAELDTFEAITEKPVAIVHFGLPWKQNGVFRRFPKPQMDAIRERGSIPLIGWGSQHLGHGPEQPDFRLSVIAGGAYDDFIAEWALAAKAWGHPFFLKFDWEMDGQWQFPWSVQLNGNQIDDYVVAWRHVHDIFTAQGATNVTWVWCPTTVSPKSVPLPPLYPGDDYVDWTCLHGYNFGGSNWLTFAKVFSGYPQNPYDSYQQILEIAPSKPIMLGEWASAEAGDGGAKKAAWIQDALEVQIPNNFPQIRAVVWFNWNSEAGRTWNIDSSAASAEAFASAIASPFYAANDFATLSTSPIPPLGSSNAPGNNAYLP